MFALDLGYGAGRAAAQLVSADPAYAGAVAYLDLDDRRSSSDRLRIHFSIGATSFGLVMTISI